MKKRIIGLDILRDIGVVFIFFYHFFVEYTISGNGPDPSINGYTYFFNILARPASLFLFIISGYALMYNHEDEISLVKYYKRRFKGLFIPFYVAYTIMFLICFLVNGEVVGHSLPISRFILTLIGMDGVTQLVVFNFYLIGEWFMSCIVICYLLFPLLAKLLKKFKYITLAAMMAWYVYLLYIHNPFAFTQLMNPLFVMVYFYIGMFLHEVFGEKAVPKAFKNTCAVLSVLIFVYFILIGFVPSMAFLKLGQEQSEIIYFVISMTMLIALRDVEISPEKNSYKFITYLSGISWFIILTHHRIMILFYSKMNIQNFAHREIFALMLVCMACTWIASIIVRDLSSKLKKLL
ncbi:Peptidoglycan/LPS O-acetylase OafA/YrhL, contains acyltransferase and SGNH-hydrolase domains [Pseudobutyrivibrio sp. YE44]|uniref:acyltransferase family protein n=1 Tax=Pseudobutyrivibrio sp. YE44 TaxID=1520802 RepID=UPI000882007D|nr:acyltransferase [Pseudobutyrivibrio sp. YE44]SDB42644.1 Peptidoglycan/LPS O-acetylase OafA/YrhL, contains acyltransferase and SGNH-hydrolase domains [Pseudobutyrivibrio sp. YE44]